MDKNPTFDVAVRCCGGSGAAGWEVIIPAQPDSLLFLGGWPRSIVSPFDVVASPAPSVGSPSHATATVSSFVGVIRFGFSGESSGLLCGGCSLVGEG